MNTLRGRRRHPPSHPSHRHDVVSDTDLPTQCAAITPNRTSRSACSLHFSLSSLARTVADTLGSVEPQEDGLSRIVHILQPNPTSPTNSIITALYTWYTFPTIGVIELLYPWKKFANFYFLCVGGMQMWKEVSLTEGQPSSYATLLFICCVELYFKGRENLARVRGDRTTNNTLVDALSSDADAFGPVRWSDVMVGDVVRVRSRETFPADLLLLRASDPPGQCWVNTKPLDGETDSKLRVAPKALLPLLETPAACEPAALRSALRGHVRCEVPNDKVNDITAQLCLDGHAPVLLSEDNFLLRGCQLRNTDWVLALVVTTGVQTKINYTPGAEDVGQPRTLTERAYALLADAFVGKGVQLKQGRVAKMVNADIMGVVIWLVVMCVPSPPRPLRHIATSPRHAPLLRCS